MVLYKVKVSITIQMVQWLKGLRCHNTKFNKILSYKINIKNLMTPIDLVSDPVAT